MRRFDVSAIHYSIMQNVRMVVVADARTNLIGFEERIMEGKEEEADLGGGEERKWTKFVIKYLKKNKNKMNVPNAVMCCVIVE